MTEPESEKCARLCKLGRTRYILLFGVIGWGVPTAILFALIQGFRLGWDNFLFHLIPALIMFPLGGILFGRYMWKMLEKMHGKTPATGSKL